MLTNLRKKNKKEMKKNELKMKKKKKLNVEDIGSFRWLMCVADVSVYMCRTTSRWRARLIFRQSVPS